MRWSRFQCCCIQVRCMKWETDQPSHMLFWSKMVLLDFFGMLTLSLVWTGSNRFCKILPSSELQTGPLAQFSQVQVRTFVQDQTVASLVYTWWYVAAILYFNIVCWWQNFRSYCRPGSSCLSSPCGVWSFWAPSHLCCMVYTIQCTHDQPGHVPNFVIISGASQMCIYHSCYSNRVECALNTKIWQGDGPNMGDR